MITLLQISWSFWKLKNFENGSTFDEDMQGRIKAQAN